MNKIELQQKLDSEGIRPDVYSLNGGFPNEAFCLAKENEKWEIYYSERGNKSGIKIFDKEEEACQYFYDYLIKALKI